MELRRYATIVRRGWWIVLGVPALVLLLTLPTFRPDTVRYRAIAKIAVTQDRAAGDTILPDFDVFNSWQSSQYVIDDLPAVIRSAAFARDVSAWISSERNLAIDASVVESSFNLESEHRIVSLIIDAPSPEAAVAIAEGSVAVLQQNGLHYWNRTSAGNLAIGVLKMPTAAVAQPRWTQPVTRLVLRLLLGLLAGIGLAFLRHYLDRTIRERADVAELGVPLVATIPRES